MREAFGQDIHAPEEIISAVQERWLKGELHRDDHLHYYVAKATILENRYAQTTDPAQRVKLRNKIWSSEDEGWYYYHNKPIPIS